ncbi:MAG: NnrS family protein [Kofleriaceae bacterium]|nr:NnrS family protein [Kofleriaceae bacterium]
MNHLATPFRLFFVGAGLIAAILIPLWLLILTGHASPSENLPPLAWHAHEMLFGYLGAVLAGFLLTATVNWTGIPTSGPIGTAMLFSLWLLARIVQSLHLSIPGGDYLGLVFFLGVALAIGQAIVRSRRWRNIGFPLLLVVLGASDLLIHLSAQGHIDSIWGKRAIWLAVDAIALIILIFGGRVVPMFTKNKLGLGDPRKKGLLDYASLVALSALMPIHALSLSPTIEAGAWLVSGILILLRLYGWGGSKALKVPLLMVLHLGWLLTGLGMILIAWVLFRPGLMPYSSALHLLFIGGFGSLSLGMMARVTLGHTGRTMSAGRPVAVSFLAILLAAGIRTLAPFFPIEHYSSLLWGAGIAWSLGFLLFVVTNISALLSRRADGKPG